MQSLKNLALTVSLKKLTINISSNKETRHYLFKYVYKSKIVLDVLNNPTKFNLIS